MAGKYEKSLGQIAVRLERNLSKAARAYTLQLVNNLVLRTPVDTGRARGSWVVSINQASFELPNLKTKSGSRTINNAAGKLKNYKLGQVVYVQSNLEYMVPLNNGTSQQAPAGFVQLAVKQTDVQFAFSQFNFDLPTR